jgi:hypothetical protein
MSNKHLLIYPNIDVQIKVYHTNSNKYRKIISITTTVRVNKSLQKKAIRKAI